MPVLFLIVVVDLIGFGVVIPLLPFYAEYYNASPDQVGLLMAIYSAAQFIAAPFWGRLSDRVGRKPVLMLSMAGAVGAYIWLGFAESLMSLFLARALSGFMAGNIATAFAYVADVTTKEDRAKGMGMIGAAFSIGFIIGPAIGGLIAGADPNNADFRTPSFVAAGLSALALVSGLFILKESLSPEARLRLNAQDRSGRMKALMAALSMPGIRVLIVLSFSATLVFASLEATFAMWSSREFGWGPLQNGYLFALIGVLAAIVQGGLLGKLAKRFGVERLIVFGALALSAGLAVMPFVTTATQLVLAMTVAALGFGILSPALNTAISVRGDNDVQGGLMGVTRSATTLSRVVGPAMGGMIFAVVGRHAPYFAGALIMAVVAIVAMLALFNRRAQTETQTKTK